MFFSATHSSRLALVKDQNLGKVLASWLGFACKGLDSIWLFASMENEPCSGSSKKIMSLETWSCSLAYHSDVFVYICLLCVCFFFFFFRRKAVSQPFVA